MAVKGDKTGYIPWVLFGIFAAAVAFMMYKGCKGPAAE